ncbi:MAG: cupin domain-containing protein [Tepidisphaerales bacterium]
MLAQRTSVVVPAGAGEADWILGHRVTFKLGPEQTGGAFSLAETRVARGGGPPPHLHRQEEEMFYILDGELDLVLGDAKLRGGEGHVQFLPRRVMHAFNNPAEREAKFLVFAMPCGFEKFIAAVAAPVAKFGENQPPPTAEVIQKIQDLIPTFGVEMHPEHQTTRQAAATVLDRRMQVLGVEVILKAGSAETGGAFCVAEVIIPQGGGTPLHAHDDEDEVYYVIDGEVEFRLAGRVATAPPGTTVYVPRGQFHTLRNLGTKPARLADVHTPGGFETFFEEASHLEPAATIERVRTVLRKHGMSLRS